MLEGVERLVDLVGFHSAGLTGATEAEVVEAVRRGDTARLAATDGHFACVAREGSTVRLARTIGVPLRYFVAKMYHGPFLVVSDRIDRIFDWCQEQRIGWQFDPAYTRMVPAHYLVELDQVGCPDPAPRYHRFFEPSVADGPADVTPAGAAYIGAAYDAVRTWIAGVPAHETIGVAFSGGIDSTAVLMLARRACEDLGRSPDLVRAVTLDYGGGADAAQAAEVVRALGVESTWERIDVPPSDYDLEAAIRQIEDYHPLDVECAAAGFSLLRAVRQRRPGLKYLLDGDGGDENLKAYPLEDSDLTLSSILKNPMLYQEGWGIDTIKHSLVYSGGLSRGYVRSQVPAATFGFEAYSPFAVRSVIARAVAMPFEVMLGGQPDRVSTLKADVVAAGIQAVLGTALPVRPKRRFQDGASGASHERVTKAWCRQVFNRHWRERLREVDVPERRSGNEMTVPAGVAARP